jgi:hypothetical protein
MLPALDTTKLISPAGADEGLAVIPYRHLDGSGLGRRRRLGSAVLALDRDHGERNRRSGGSQNSKEGYSFHFNSFYRIAG